MFTYDHGVIGVKGTSDNKSGYQKPKTLSIGPRSGDASKLTFAVSGATVIPAVSGYGVEATFDANAFGEPTEVLKSGILLNTDAWQTFAANCELKDIQIRSGRLFGTFLSSAYPEGAEAIAFGWTNNTESAGCQLQQLAGNLIRTVDLVFRQNGANVEIKWVRAIYTRTDASAYYGKKYLTTADSGSTTPPVSAIRAHWVSTGFLPVTITASGANVMTDSAYVIKGDSRHPVAFNVTALALPQGTLDAYGAVNINVTAAGGYNNGIADKTAITLHDGAALVQLKDFIYGYGHNVLTLDGSEFVASETQVTYLNNLVMMNGAKISGGRVNAGYSSSVKWEVVGEDVSMCNADIRLVGNGLNNLHELEINVSDMADGPDFVVNGDIYQNQQDNKKNEHGAFVKTGVGTMLVNGTISSTHGDPTRILEGTLLLGKSGALDPAHNMKLEGGTLALAANTENAGGAFTVTKNSSLDFGDGATLALAGLSVADNATLTLAGNVPKKGFKVSATLDAATIGRIEFADGRNGYVLQNSDGYIRTANGLHITIY
jgi:autotransporter-associated beta strand protein